MRLPTRNPTAAKMPMAQTNRFDDPAIQHPLDQHRALQPIGEFERHSGRSEEGRKGAQQLHPARRYRRLGEQRWRESTTSDSWLNVDVGQELILLLRPCYSGDFCQRLLCFYRSQSIETTTINISYTGSPYIKCSRRNPE
jgi:hypothetical protein